MYRAIYIKSVSERESTAFEVCKNSMYRKNPSFSVLSLAWLVYLLPNNYPYFDRKGAEIGPSISSET